MASKIRGVFGRNSAGGPLGWQARDGLTTKEHVDRLPIIISGVWEAPNCSPSPKLGSGTGESFGGKRGVSALETWGVADQVVGMSFDTTASKTGPQKRGLCPHRTENGERPAAFRLSVTISWSWWLHAVFVTCSWVSSSPEHLSLQTLPNPLGEHRREDFGTGIMVEEVATVLEDVKG
ncbi:hypothetical protein GWK47_031519 [Chionoecetes opilio]|uniref:Uncharacterized protein n=1 Tax=Chionoecetes opilio TaxID=41210 RepID=A0A8J4YV23_CHIOP|nr:hypothetical protein GWK47_031519 [Chionoecetes opilio]